jgi:uncharacterized protein (TIGR03437 family)
MKTWLLCALCSVAFGATLVAPNSNATTAGNASNAIPQGTVSIEFQESVGSGQFPPNPIQITGISFRATPRAGPVNATIGSVRWYLSTSSNFPNTSGGKPLMSSTFANNVGPDKTLVVSGTNVPLHSSGCSAPGPCPFDINIVFTTPFYYNPNNGALLIDLLETNLNGSSGAIDAASFSAPGGSLAQVSAVLGSASGTFQYQGNIVQITYSNAQNLSIQPGGVVNSASQAAQILPNGSVAQGGIFTVYLAGILPVPSQLISAYPVSLSFNNLSMTVTVGTTVVPVLMFGCAPYFGGTVVDGILPSSTPTGTGTITVTFLGQTGPPAPITVVANSFAWFTNNAGGKGPGAFADGASGVALSPLHSTNPGKEIAGYGTGLGAAPITNDTNGGHVVITPASLKLWVGPVQVAASDITFTGRASSAGEDQINFRVPQGILGCTVPVVLQIGNNVSNSATISIAASGLVCNDSPAGLGLTANELTQLSTEGSFSTSQILLYRFVGQGDGVDATFENINAAQLLVGTHVDVPSLGTCVVSTTGGAGNQTTPLDAGASALTIKGPAGSFPIPPATAGQIGEYSAQLDSTNSFFNPGTYTVSSTGGPGVGAFSAPLTIGAAPVWSNQGNLATINRAQGATVTWTGGSPNGVMLAQGDVRGNGLHVRFTCSSSAGPGQLTVPPSVLLAIPPTSAPGSGLAGTLDVFFTNGIGTFSALKLYTGYVISVVASEINVVYQ